MIESYLQHEKERAAQGIPPLALNAEQTKELCKLLQNPPAGKEEFLVDLITNRVSPGVDPAAEVKARFLGEIAMGKTACSLVSKKEAVRLLGTMLGGYNLSPMVALLQDGELGGDAAEALSKIILAADIFDEVLNLSKSNANAKKVIDSWANAEWFTSNPEMPETFKSIVYKVEGETNTDDFSPASHAFSRPDIPLHALSLGETRFPDGIEKIKELKQSNLPVTFVGDVVGTGSSRKSAANSLLWAIGEDIPYVPNKRKGGLILGGQIAPIFFNTAQDSGALPIRCDVSKLETGMKIVIKTREGKIEDEQGNLLAESPILPATLPDEYRAGGRVPLIIGHTLTDRARAALGMEKIDIFAEAPVPPKGKGGYTLAQKMVGKACGLEGVMPGTSCEPIMTTVGSQDTTGPMTRDEMIELACLQFQSDFVLQSFCHTAAYPKPADIKTHNTLPKFITERKGVALRPGDGVIHSWLNRFLLPDTVGTGGDSHTRFPIGISFPAGSGLVAFAAALGKMPLDMPESVLVKFTGKLRPGITLRDVVNAIPYFAIKKGMLTVEKKGKINIFNGRILEIQGLPDLHPEQAFELTDASAERSAAACSIQLSVDGVASYLRSNVALMKQMIKDGYSDAETIKNRIAAAEEWLKNPSLLEADADAEYAETLEINLEDITEPILACPNDPDDVKLLSEVQGTNIDEVFIGSCMTNIGHYRAAGEILNAGGQVPTRLWITPPTIQDEQILRNEGFYAIFGKSGARTEIPGCSLCMGNQARVKDNAVVFSTSTRNFNNRIGTGAQVYLGSAELAAVVATLGKLPTPAEYLAVVNEKLSAKSDSIYRCSDFSQMG